MRLRTTIFEPLRGKPPIKVEIPAPPENRDSPANAPLASHQSIFKIL